MAAGSTCRPPVVSKLGQCPISRPHDRPDARRRTECRPPGKVERRPGRAFAAPRTSAPALIRGAANWDTPTVQFLDGGGLGAGRISIIPFTTMLDDTGMNGSKEAWDSAQAYLELEDGVLVRQCEVHTYRSHGPGGQKRNKTSSGVRLRHRPTGLAVTAVEDRSQHVNKARAIRRLRKAIALHVRTSIDLEHYNLSPQLSACIDEDGRIAISKRDRLYCSVIREILDIMAACGVHLREASANIGVSTGRLVRLLRRDPKLWERVNQMRMSAGLKQIR